MHQPAKVSRPSLSPSNLVQHPAHSTATASDTGAPQLQSLQTLQHTLGNQAIMRLLAKTPVQPRATPGAGLIQRKEFGLRDAGNTTAFVTEALKFWKDAANKDKPLKDYSDFLMTTVNDMLKKMPSREIKSVYKTSGVMGSFGRGLWTIKINTAAFSKTATKVGQLTQDEAAEIADTIFHEARHSEQFYKMAQVLAGDKKALGDDAKISAEIVKQLDMDKDAVDDAVKNKIVAGATNADLVNTVREWEKIAAGVHSKYKELVNDFTAFDEEPDKAERDARAVTKANLTTTKTALQTRFSGWETKQLKEFEAELKRVNDMPTKTAQDTMVQTHLQNIVDMIKKVLKQWKDDTVQDEKTIAKLASPLAALSKEADQAYRDHTHEKDAWAVGRGAKAEFNKQASAPAKAPAH